MTSKHDFEELDAPASAAKKLGLSVATLRKYSLIVEKVTGNSEYFERNSQRARLYRQKDIDDLDAFHKLAKTKHLKLAEAARQIYAVSEKGHEEEPKQDQQLMDSQQFAKVLNALQQTIASQNQAIENLQEQMTKIQQQNEELLKKETNSNTEIDPKIAALPDISGIVTADDDFEDERELTAEQKRQKIVADAHKSEEEIHNEILNKAKENAQKHATTSVHRTLADMQVPKQKKHWWQRFLNY